MTNVTLKNGLVVGNFSSPHSFTFDTGEVLERVSKEWSDNHSMVKSSSDTLSYCKRYSNSVVYFAITDEIVDALILAVKQVDIMLVSFSMLKALDEIDNLDRRFDLMDVMHKCRVPFLNKDAKKTVSSSIFCM
jgi:hypothetical protein